MEMTPSPLPWTEKPHDRAPFIPEIHSADGPVAGMLCVIAYGEKRAQANKDLILKAVNSHAALVAALKSFLRAYALGANGDDPSAVDEAQAALRRAGEEV